MLLLYMNQLFVYDINYRIVADNINLENMCHQL